MNETDMSVGEAVNDTDRAEYFRGNCEALLAAITEDGVDIRSYFAWSKFSPSCSPRGRTGFLTAYFFRPIGQLRMVHCSLSSVLPCDILTRLANRQG